MKRANDENKLIKTISSIFPDSKLRLNKCFESDAEVVSVSGQKLLFTMDEFSEEDMFRDDDPYALGWNVATGAMSDIFACGGIPLFYSHAMVIGQLWDEKFIKKFSQGVADVLKETGTVFIGGDFGKGKQWHYTAAIIGKPRERVVSRKGVLSGDLIYLSGKIGLGNVEAAIKLFSRDPRFKIASAFIRDRFELRHKESEFMSNYAAVCIDTSDGVFNALNVITEINNVGYEIGDLPYINLGSLGTSIVSLPKELLFLGEAGEYELLFTIRPDSEKEFLSQSKKQRLMFHKIGRITDSGKRLQSNRKTLDLSDLNVRARDFDDRQEYLNYLISYLKEQ